MHRFSARGQLSALLFASLALGGACASAQSPETTSVPSVPALHALDPALRDTTADPCTDFYQYACGGWLKQHPIPADRSAYGPDVELEDQDDAILRAILEKAAAGGAARTPDEQKIGDAYAACMNTTAIDADGLKPLAGELDQLNALTSLDQLPAVLATLHNEGVANLFVFGAQQDDHDATLEIAYVAQPRLGLPGKSYYTRTDAESAELRTEYTAHVQRVFALLGEPPAQAAADAATVLRLETALAADSLTREQMRDPNLLYHKTPLEQFEANSPELDFPAYLKAVHAPALNTMNVAEPVYFLSLHELLTSTSIADIRTLLRWDVERSTPGAALPQALDDEDFAFYGKVLDGTPEQEPRWKRCTETVDDELGDALGHAYVDQRFTAADKARALALTQSIEAAAKDDIGTLSWLGPDTKDAARAKLMKVANNIGYPAQWRNYATLSISPDDAFTNAEHAEAYRAARQTAKIGQPVDRSEWSMTTPTVDAYYDPQLNSINFPAGILQPPYFDPSQDDAVNYGSAGAVIGHELTHGFDDEGRQFDGDGNLRDWWTKADAKQFDARVQCVEQQYDGYTQVEGVPVNGRLTLGEDLADLAGLRLAWLAYNAAAQAKSAAANGPADKQADAAYGNLTPAQQFFVAYGQSWCEATRPAALRERAQVDPHAPEKYRVNGVVRNMPSFAEAFSCKTGAPMAPADRCRLW